MAAPRLDVVIVGAQRAGSTGLGATLAGHPQVYVCPDEVPYFEDPFYGNSSPHELERALAGAAPGQLRGIHRPDYLARPECAPRIAADAPGARVVAVLRDPVDRAVAAYYWYVQFGLLPLVPVEAGLTRLLDGWSDPAYPRSADILEYGRYGHHLAHYVAALGSDRVLALRSDALDSPATHRRLFGVLGVDEEHRPPARARRANAGAYDIRRLRWLRLRARLAFSWDSTDTYRYRPRRRRRPLGFVPTAFVVGVDRVLLSRLLPAPQPRLPPVLDRALRSWYASDLDDLESLLGWDLADWRNGRSGSAQAGSATWGTTTPAATDQPRPR